MNPGALVSGRFEIERLAGRGGMGAVYRAIDRETGAPVAVKRITSMDAAAVSRFAREATLLATINHPGIVSYVAHGINEADQQLYLVMEWLEGEDLATRLASGPLEIENALDLVEQAAGALGFAHASGIVHRDVKPANLFLPQTASSSVRLKVLDFGLARPTGGAHDATRTGVMMGTPGYIAPEQAVRGARGLDARADVFALGCVLFECITGRPAFVGENLLAVLAKILLEAPPRPSELRSGLAPAIDDLVARMLDKDPGARPADGSSVATEIANLRAGGAFVTAEARAEVLTGGEQRLLSVCMIGSVFTEGSTMDAAAPRSGALSVRTSAQLESIAGSHAAHLWPLANGCAVISMAGHGVATDQAVRAARLALALNAALPGCPIALATGRGELASVPVGEVIDRAARLLARRLRTDDPSPPIEIDDVTAGLLDARFELERTDGSANLKSERGLGDDVRTLLGRGTPFVGRDRELTTLVTLFDESVGDSVARAAVVIAQAGAGKSRLRSEFTRMLGSRAQPPAIWLARGEQNRADLPFDQLGQIIRAAARIERAESPGTQRTKLLARVSAAIAEAAVARDVAAFLGEIAQVPFPDDASERLRAARHDARLIGPPLLDAWLRWLAAECTLAPVVCIIEDLQWCDPLAVKFIDFTLRDCASRPLLVLALARPELNERFPTLWRERDAQEIRLPPLGAKACERLVRQVLGDAPAGLIAAWVARSEGNAFYLEEIIRAAADGQANTLPDTVLAMAQSRIDALSPEARRALRAASIFGEAFWRGGVATLIGQPVEVVEPILTALVAGEVIVVRDTGRLEGREYRFRHALLREAAYSTLTDKDRILGHRLAAEWLQSAGEPEAVVIAEHYESGGAALPACECYVQAAQQALAMNDFDAVLRRVDRALALGAERAPMLEIQAIRGKTYACLSRWQEARRAFEAAAALVPEGDDARLTELLLNISIACFWTQDTDALKSTAERAHALAGNLGRLDLKVDALGARGLGFACEGRGPEAVEMINASVALGGDLVSLPTALAAGSFYHSGQYDRARSYFGVLVARVQRFGDVTTEIYAHSLHGLAMGACGQYAESDAAFVRSLEIATKLGLDPARARALSMSAGYLLETADYEAAESVAREVCVLSRAIEFAAPGISSTIDLGFVAVRRGDPDTADARVAEIGDTVARSRGAHATLWRGRLAQLRAEIAASRGHWESAIALAADVIEQNRTMARIKYFVRAHAVHAQALAALGRRDQAITLLRSTLPAARTTGDPTLALRIAGVLAQLEGDSETAREAIVAVDRIATALPRARGRESFLASVPVDELQRIAESRATTSN